jgi:hypothetical protein
MTDDHAGSGGWAMEGSSGERIRLNAEPITPAGEEAERGAMSDVIGGMSIGAGVRAGQVAGEIEHQAFERGVPTYVPSPYEVGLTGDRSVSWQEFRATPEAAALPAREREIDLEPGQ